MLISPSKKLSYFFVFVFLPFIWICKLMRVRFSYFFHFKQAGRTKFLFLFLKDFLLLPSPILISKKGFNLSVCVRVESLFSLSPSHVPCPSTDSCCVRAVRVFLFPFFLSVCWTNDDNSGWIKNNIENKMLIFVFYYHSPPDAHYPYQLTKK